MNVALLLCAIFIIAYISFRLTFWGNILRLYFQFVSFFSIEIEWITSTLFAFGLFSAVHVGSLGEFKLVQHTCTNIQMIAKIAVHVVSPMVYNFDRWIGYTTADERRRYEFTLQQSQFFSHSPVVDSILRQLLWLRSPLCLRTWFVAFYCRLFAYILNTLFLFASRRFASN